MLEKEVKEQLTKVEKQGPAKMLGTIAFPKNIEALAGRLPKANYKEASIKRSPSIGALEKLEVLEDNKMPRCQTGRNSIGREDNSKQERNYRRYGCNPVIEARAELNQGVNDKRIKMP